ncbi:MAG: MFS transporter [Candidatus Methanomethylophilaceae archaeon]|nr:MFS transporter [Candidatus Methanomethylophilaceae archaeon]
MIETRLGRRPLMLLIVLLSMFGPLSTDMYLSGLPVMIRDFGTTESVMNMSLYLFMLVLSFSILLLGPISDKYGRRKVLTCSMAVYTAANVACCFTDDVWVFIALRMAQAAGGGGAMTAAFALIKDCFDGNDRSRVLSVTAAIGILGPILAPVIGTALINAAGWRSTFWFPAGVSTVCLALGSLLPGYLPADRYQGSMLGSLTCLAAVTRDSNFVLFMLMMCTFTGSQLAYIAVSSYVYQDGFGLSTTEYSLVLASSCIIGLVIARALSHANVSPRKMVACLFCLGTLSLAMMLVLASHHWALFMLSIVPCCAVTITARSFGYGILMGQHEGDNGSVSSVLNFTTFMFAFVGMVISSSFPPHLFIYGVATMLAISCGVFLTGWTAIRKRGYPLKGME